MRLNQWMTFLSTGLMLMTNPLAAQGQAHMEQIQVPQCLAAKMPSQFEILAENNEFKIINLPSDELQSISLLADQLSCGRFVNVSGQLADKSGNQKAEAAHQLLTKPALKQNTLLKSEFKIKHRSAVIEALEQVKSENILKTLKHLTDYENRSATKNTGVQAAKWLKSEFLQMAKDAGRTDVDAYFVKTGVWYKQPSLVTVINKDSRSPGIVIGAHMDTLDGRMPGAGDDGSGSSSVMEIARVLLNSHQEFNRPIYIIWYAAEERGLVGSQYVVEHFEQEHIPVLAAVQFDMTGFRNDRNDPTMWVFRDYTNDMLTDYLSELIKTYIGVPVAESECGYGCSDHASWTAAGVPAAFPCETDFEHHNQKIHTSGDTMDRLTPEHMVNFAKLGLAFAIELASD
ncbi:aminopeptidase LapA [Legionella quinlivanii]|uniref:aminopeptidase LapA n=1 Tax=Legionella quinlivanii TaxID=45073 RepID=UPI002242C890|nr:M28 family peptidase [Legionella quinlivanii]MCW8452483.1 M28 family peptidase [Legionella quinlivanii]